MHVLIQSYHDVSTAPSIMQHISTFLISKDGLLKCVGLESADFHMPPSDNGLNLNILLANLKFKLPLHQPKLVVELHRPRSP
jgi:hypothetical protein